MGLEYDGMPGKEVCVSSPGETGHGRAMPGSRTPHEEHTVLKAGERQ